MEPVQDEAADTADEATSLSAQIMALMGKIAARFFAPEQEEGRWISEHSSDPLIAEIMHEGAGYTLRVIEAIGQLQPVNGATIAARYKIPKGTVSKVAQRLVAQQLISRESLPNNRKEILFRLTPLGEELFRFHHAFDARMEHGFMRFLRRYTPEELRLLVRVLNDASTASFLEPPAEDEGAGGTPPDSTSPTPFPRGEEERE